MKHDRRVQNPVKEKLVEEFIQVVGEQDQPIDLNKSFLELGMNSIKAVDFVEAVNNSLGLELGVEVIFDFRGIPELAEHIAELYSAEEEKNPSPESALNSDSSMDIAIIGISGKFADSENIEDLWSHLKAGECCIKEVRRRGWDEKTYYTPEAVQKNRSVSKWGGMLSHIDQFDAGFFDISSEEAERMDPQQRLCLEESYKAFEDADYPAEKLAGKKVGVFIGGRTSDYRKRLWNKMDTFTFWGNEMSMLASRISYFFNFKGPSLTVDTACSSSLVAIHLACDSIRKGESEMALAGGVFIASTPEFFMMSSQAGLLSPDGQCKAFDPQANGMVLGEGVGVAVLKRLDDAVRDQDHIYGVIKGSVINQAGRTNGMTAPSVTSQKELIQEVYTKSQINPETIGYIEAHGTGTMLGDLMELKALSVAFKEITDKTEFCVIGSHKPNIGHATLAAGMAGLFKILMAMKDQVLPPHRPTGQGQDHFLNNSPFVFNTKLRQWKSHPDMPLRAGLNALGSNGTNAHIIIEEWGEQSVQSISPIQKPYYLFLFSAKNIEALHQKLIDLADWLEHDGEQYSAEEVAYTLSAARSHFDVRYAFIASGLTDLRHHLRKVIQEGFELGGLWHQRASTFQPASEKLNNGQQLIHTLSNGTVLHRDTYQEYVAKLSDLYIQGYDLDWTGLYHKNRKVPLPSYPFCKTSYWTTEQEDTVVQEPAVFSSYGLQMRDMEELLAKLLLKQLQSLGILADQRMTLADMQKKLGMSYIYRKWLARSLQFLVDKQWVVCDETDQYSLNPSIEKEQDAWEVWERQKQYWLATPDAKTQTILVEHTLRSLPRILTGEVLATDIIFPNSSMELVEGIYQNNAVADYFNNLLAQKVIDYIQERLRQNPDARIRIIEIGAGTGGTSVRVLDHLKPYLGHLEDYCYTDISKAFLVYAEKRFKADYPFVSYRVYNAEAEAAEQGISTDTYDIAIATNVLHATKNIMQTLRRVKAVLKADGLLILNEISDNSLFLHLTFGLLEGWWLFQDDTLRLPGGPAVSAEGWRRVLEQEGFKQVRFPAVEDHAKGQQIIMALSNGHVRQEAAQKQVFIQQREQKQPAVTTKNHHIAAALKNWMAEHISHALSTEAQAIDFRAAFRDYGVDSISGNNLVQVINQTFFLDLGTTILFDYSSIDQLTNFLLTHYNDAIATFFGKEKPPAEETTVGHLEERKEESSTHEMKQVSKGRQKGPIAIVGISGKFANSENVHALWEHLSKGTNLIDHTSRWRRPGDKDETVKNWETGSFIEDIDQFDPFFFNISGVEASYMDPQQRLFLMASWQALEDAGYAGKSIEGRLCGVYAGCNSGDYHHLMNDYPSREVPQAFWGNLGSVIPARIAYYLNLQGPAIAVDTACSSSLVAMHLACQGLWTGEIEMALAGGVSIQCTPELYQAEHQAGMLSPTGQCYTFDDRANGFIPGEGVGVVVLKRLEDALADGDHIYGVVRGSGINQDGTTNGITAPSLRSQVRLERAVYDQFGINPEEIQMIEAHGTGTKLGDPIEYQALTQAFQHYTDEKSYCAIGSIKTNIGHAQMAAGIAGVIKILLALKHRKIPPSLHFEQGNSNIQFKDSPFFVNTELKEWEVKPGAKRCAAVSSFGVSGTNAHMVIEEAPEVIRKHPVQPGYLLVLSARSEEALQKQAQQLINYSNENQEDVGDICYTLLVGRQHFKHRLSCVVRDQHDMVAQLEQWLENKAVSSVFTHVVHEREHREQPALKKFGNHCIRQSDVNKEEYMDNLSTVADLFVQGYELDYPALFANGQYSRVPLPTYPFALERYWVPQPDEAREMEATPKAAPTQPQAVEEMAASTEESQLMTFAESWQRQDLTDERMPLPAVWVCFLSNPTHQQALRTVLQTRYPGTEVIFVAQGTAERRESPHHYQLIREDGVAYRQTLQRIAADWGPGFALLYLWPLEDPAVISDYMPLFHLFQAVREAKPARFLWAGEWTTPLERSYLESWIGWERSLGLILPQMGVAGVLQKAAPEMDMAKWLNRLADELASPAIESVLYEGEQRHVCRMEPTDTTEGEGRGLIKEGGTYLITGGGGGLGRRLAANLTRSRSVNLVLTGRSPLSAALAAEIKQWEGTGSHVIYCQADVCDRAAMADVQQKAKTRFGGIDGVIHAAGLVSKEPFFAKSAADFACVLAPKVQGAQVLDEVLAPESLDFVCYFSSSSAILGDMGAGDYAMANRFLMAYAYQRQTVYPGKTLVIQWPLWKEGGMGLGDDEQTHMYLASSGQQALETEEGLALFERLLGQASTQHLVLKGQPDRVHRFLGLGQTAAGESSPERLVARNLPAGQGRREEMKGLSVRQCVEWDLKEIASSLLQIPRNQLHLESNLADFGFDSITLATFAERLTAHYQVEITPALFFGYPTLGKLADYYQTEHAEAMAAFYREGTTMEKPSSPMSADRQREQKAKPQPAMPEKRTEQPPQPKPQVPEAQQELEPIAVIGMSGRFPGARTIDQMWEHLVKGEEQVQPAARWAEEGEQWRFGVVPGASEFDPAFFEISPREAQSMDPRQRLLLQEAWRALEDAGYGAKQIKRHRIGMFVGVENGDYQYLSGFQGPITANHDAILAARLSYVLNLNGPNMAINTACSSGLVGLHQACQSLRMGDCDTAIAAGVNLILMPQTLEAIDQAGMLSPDGRCYAFDERANGMVPGEAVAVVVLKRLSQAEADKDPIYAVIRGSGINHDGKTNGITAPNGVVQAQLYRSVYDQYGIHPESLSYVVTHGTGTRLGDPVEINGLRDAFRSYTDKEGFCAITSTKTNFGHTFAASGLVSLISMVQAMRHETIPASLHCEQENRYIQWKNSPFYVNKTNREWKDSAGTPRRGAVSAFGMSGTNVHLVVESYPKEVQATKKSSLPYYLLALSAKTEEALTEKRTDLIAFLESPEGQEADLSQISYTLLQGRQHFRHRYVVVVKDQTEALYLLKQFKGGEHLPNSYSGEVSEGFMSQKVMELFGSDLIQQSHNAATSEQYQEILQGLSNLYCQGYDLPWKQMWKEEPERVHLPTYPFARNSYWAPKASEPEQTPVVDSSQPEIATALSVVANDKTISIPASSPVEMVLPDSKQDSIEEESYEEQGLEELQEELADSLAEALYIEREMILSGKKFIELGLDSIVGVEWIKTLNKTYGIAIKATKVYDYPTLLDFTQYVASELGRLKKRPNKQKPLSAEGKGDTKETLKAPIMKIDASPTSIHGNKNPALLNQKPASPGVKKNVIRPESLGDKLFQTRYRCKWNYMAGSMAQGVASEALVIAMAEANLLSFFGSAGLDGDRLASHIQHIQSVVGPNKPYGMCLIANVNNLEEEWEQAQIFITHGVPFIEASAFSSITAPLVYCRVKGIKKQKDGILYFPRRIIGKCSRLEIAKQFMAPPPEDLVDQLLEEGLITAEEAVLSRSIPMVDDIVLEADSGGHTDRGVLSALVPSVLALRKDIQQTYSYPEPILVGCGGGIGTPEAVASAFMMGADFVLTGSINQCTVESGAHDVIKELLSTISIHDTAVTVAGDMFEIGAKAQVVRKHTQFYNRANRLYELFMQYNAIEEIPQEIKQEIEINYFKRTFAEVWDLVCEYKKKKNPQQLTEASVNPRFKMALIFKWYFAYCNRATLNGDLTEKDNFQIFCGPALGAFNQWVKGTPYEDWKKRHVVDVAVLLMEQACEHLQTRYSPRAVAVETPSIQQRAIEDPRLKETDIAIVGISGQFPKADNINAFWENIISGKDCISEIPPSRWPMAHYYDTDPEVPGKSTSKWMGVLEDVDKFDPNFFNIPPVDAIAMDPQQRMFLENCWSCIEDAGIRPSDLSGSQCGVFVGCATSDYGQLFNEQNLNSRMLMGNTTSILAARISYLLNLSGPSLAIETACSSSLVAVAEACNSLVLGNSDLALAGGVCMMAGPSLHIMTSKAGMLSQQGRCRTFDQQADGFVPGEGVGVVLLKRLSDAIRDKDTIYGVIKGWGVNQDGKTNGITAPNGKAQTDLEKSVYEKFGIDPADISLVEAHGTGTKLGDPIEVEALTEAFQSFTTEKQYCALGSVKSNIGHLLTAAGIAGLIKVLLAIKHRTLPPTIHYDQLNEHIDLADSPFFISKNKEPWTTRQGKPRSAAVSSFGFSGTNAHMVVEEYLPLEESDTAINYHVDQPVLMVLSAKNDKQLKHYADRMIHFIQKNPAIDLQQMAYTLQVGREPMECRMAFLVHSSEELLQTFRMYRLGQQPSNLVTGTLTRENKKPDKRLNKTFEEGQWHEAALWWIQGGEVDWKLLYGDHLPHRINLPTYPFERKSFWPKKDDKTLIENVKVSPSQMPEPVASLPSKTKQTVSLQEVEQQTLKPDQIQLRALKNMPDWPDHHQEQVLSPVTLYKIDQPIDYHQVSHYAEEDEAALQDMLIDSLVQTLFIEGETVDLDQNFYDIGLDSILGVEWMRLINKTQGLSLEATTLYDYPTIRELARYILSMQGVDAQPQANSYLTTEQADADDTALIVELSKSLAEIMFLDPSRIDEDVHFSDLGLDSILGVEWIRVLNKRYRTTIEATNLYDYPTLREFAAWMQKDQVKQSIPSTVEEEPALSPPTLEEILQKVEQGALEVTEAHVLLQKYNLV